MGLLIRYPANWKDVSRFIRFDRAHGRCECEGECGLHRTHPGPRRCLEIDGTPAMYARGVVVLTVAHLNAAGGPCRCDPLCGDPLHLKAMCNRCHLRYDMPLHRHRAYETRRAGAAIAELFAWRPFPSPQPPSPGESRVIERREPMAKFRKKPVVIEAFQWFKNGDHPEDGEETFVAPSDGQTYRCEGKLVRYFRHPDVPGEQLCSKCGIRMHEHGWIDTLENGHNVCPGDWIIRGVKGEFYPCKDDIFRATYDAMEEP